MVRVPHIQTPPGKRVICRHIDDDWHTEDCEPGQEGGWLAYRHLNRATVWEPPGTVVEVGSLFVEVYVSVWVDLSELGGEEAQGWQGWVDRHGRLWWPGELAPVINREGWIVYMPEYQIGTPVEVEVTPEALQVALDRLRAL